jgi:hypothetical protein
MVVVRIANEEVPHDYQHDEQPSKERDESAISPCECAASSRAGTHDRVNGVGDEDVGGDEAPRT